MPQKHSLRKENEKLYRVWAAMVYRCSPKNAERYPSYGGRGITVDESWMKFEQFYTDMADSFKQGLSIERLNNELGYSKSNCIWATTRVQHRNRRGLLWITINGETKILSDWALENGLSISCVQHRYHRMGIRGDALIAPVVKTNNGRFGDKVHTAKITANDAIEIRKCVELGTSQKEMSKRFNLSSSAINFLIKGKTWKQAI